MGSITRVRIVVRLGILEISCLPVEPVSRIVTWGPGCRGRRNEATATRERVRIGRFTSSRSRSRGRGGRVYTEIVGPSMRNRWLAAIHGSSLMISFLVLGGLFGCRIDIRFKQLRRGQLKKVHQFYTSNTLSALLDGKDWQRCTHLFFLWRHFLQTHWFNGPSTIPTKVRFLRSGMGVGTLPPTSCGGAINVARIPAWEEKRCDVCLIGVGLLLRGENGQ